MNNAVSRRCPNNKVFAGSGSLQYRVASVAGQQTQGVTKYMSDVYKRCGMVMSQLQESFWRQKEKRRNDDAVYKAQFKRKRKRNENNTYSYAYACSSLLVCEYWYQVLLSIVSSIVLPGTLVVPICCTDFFACKRKYTIDLNFNHAHHRDTYRCICSTNLFACKLTYQYAYD